MAMLHDETSCLQEIEAAPSPSVLSSSYLPHRRKNLAKGGSRFCPKPPPGPLGLEGSVTTPLRNDPPTKGEGGGRQGLPIDSTSPQLQGRDAAIG